MLEMDRATFLHLSLINDSWSSIPQMRDANKVMNHAAVGRCQTGIMHINETAVDQTSSI